MNERRKEGMVGVSCMEEYGKDISIEGLMQLIYFYFYFELLVL